jgi:hypothetical protein
MRTLQAAHIPTWLRIQLDHASRHVEGATYKGVGWHLGYHHSEYFALDSKLARAITDDEIEHTPTAALRKLFQSEKHPRTDLVDVIPANRRRDFLYGLTYGICGEELPE